MRLSIALLLRAIISSGVLAAVSPTQACFAAATEVAGCVKPIGGDPWFNLNRDACYNTNHWLANSAKCIKKVVDEQGLENIYGILEGHCAGTQTYIDSRAWLKAVDRV